MKSTETVPLTVITGFLGAGKTTHLNRLIRAGLPANSLILVNDFGAINIDAELIEYQDDRILSLGNGCICCTLGGTLAEQLTEALRQRPRPGAIYIEASGIADPGRIADIARVSRKLRLESVQCLVDGGRARYHAACTQTGDIWRAQITAATQLFVNRLSGDDPGAIDLVRGVNDTAALSVEKEPIGTPPLTGSASPVTFKATAPATAVASHRWRSYSLQVAAPVDAKRLEMVIRSYQDVLLRMKGILHRHDRTGPQVLQVSGTRIQWLPASKTAAGNPLVVIGIAGPRFEALVNTLRELGNAGATLADPRPEGLAAG